MIEVLSPEHVSTMLADGGEIAFIDVRDIVHFGSGHPLLAMHLPLGRLEIDVARLIPRPGTRVVVTDGGDGRAQIAAGRLEQLGYHAVSVLDGGAPGWQAAGHTLFPELEVSSKGFGDFVTRNAKPTFITPRELAGAIDSGADVVVIDSRPRAEYFAGNIPGSIDAPGPEMLRCFDDLVPSASTTVVVNCMSRTRGILGGLSLVAAGVPNEIRVLENGTRGWLLEGLDLERGADCIAAPPTLAARERAVERALALAHRAGIEIADVHTVDAWRSDTDRTTYLFDVRSQAEFESGHIPGSRSAPEGLLVMSPDHYFATLNARFVIVDDDTVRSVVAALWLAQMGWGEVAVLEEGIFGRTLVAGPEQATVVGYTRDTDIEIDALALDAMRDGDGLGIIDVSASDAYERGHIRGARWCARTALGEAIGADDDPPWMMVLASEDGVLAHLAAADLVAAGIDANVRVLAGGMASWTGLGLDVEAGFDAPMSPRDDHWLASSERPGDERQNVLDYLAWETELLGDIEASGEMRYRNLIW